MQRLLAGVCITPPPTEAVDVGPGQADTEDRHVRAESALNTSTFVRIHAYAKISQIRCSWDIAS
jgi:hypothetical protein